MFSDKEMEIFFSFTLCIAKMLSLNDYSLFQCDEKVVKNAEREVNMTVNKHDKKASYNY